MGYRVAIVFPASAISGQSARIEDTRFAGVAAALRDVGVEAEAAPYADEAAERVRAQLLRADGVLVWVNPIEQGRDRSVLDALLEDVAAAGVFVSAHPETIRKMGTKEVLYRTRSMSWGCDTRLYATAEALRGELPRCLAAGTPRVLKRLRGSSGDGVWKVEPADPADLGGAALLPAARLRVRHARRGSVEEEMSLDAFLKHCEPFFAAGGGMIDQAYQPRLTDGMVRCYLVGDRVAGFGEQRVNALFPAASGADPRTAPPPGPRLYYPADPAGFPAAEGTDGGRNGWRRCAGRSRSTRRGCRSSGTRISCTDRRMPRGADSFVLCEINVSSVYPFPDDALAPLAAATRARLRR